MMKFILLLKSILNDLKIEFNQNFLPMSRDDVLDYINTFSEKKFKKIISDFEKNGISELNLYKELINLYTFPEDDSNVYDEKKEYFQKLRSEAFYIITKLIEEQVLDLVQLNHAYNKV